MSLSSIDLTDWIARRRELLIAAWTPELSKALEWEAPFAEAFAGELHGAMLTAILGGGSEVSVLRMVADSGTGLDRKTEKAVAVRFYNVTLKLARAATRKRRYADSNATLPYLEGIAGQSCAERGHGAMQGIVLPHDHPFWRRWHPPLDMDCECSTIQVTRGRLGRLGLKITGEDELADRQSRISAGWPPAFEPLLDFRR